MNLHHWQTHLWHLGQVPCAIKASHALCSLCTKAARRQQLSSEISKITLFLKGAEDKALEKTILLLRGLLRASFQRCSSNASLPYASSYKSVHRLDQATPSLGVKGFLFSVTHFVPALTVNISKLLSEADHKSAAHLSPAHFLANQYVSIEALMDIFKWTSYSCAQLQFFAPREKFSRSSAFCQTNQPSSGKYRQCDGSQWQDSSNHSWKRWGVWGLLNLEKTSQLRKGNFSVLLSTFWILIHGNSSQ